MAVSKSKKQAFVKTLQDDVLEQKSVLLLTTNSTKKSLNAKDNFKMRFAARKEGLVFKVFKNSLLKKFVKTELPALQGQTYVVYMEDKSNSDEITVPKISVKMVNTEFKDNFKIIGSLVNGEFFDVNQTVTLSITPSFTDSMGMMAGSINQIIAKLAIAIKEIPAGVARGVSEVSKTKN